MILFNVVVPVFCSLTHENILKGLKKFKQKSDLK